MSWLRDGLIMILLAAVLGSALGVVHARHQTRSLFVSLQVLLAARDRMNVEWGRLQLEQSTQTTHERIGTRARQQLGMRVPTALELVILKRKTRQ